MMVELRKAYPHDFEKIFPLLLEFNNPNISKELWKKFLFSNYWKFENGFSGTMILDGNKVVGFLGYIFYNRTINYKTEKFCNLTSWIVQKEYRIEHKMKLWEPLDELKDYTLIGLSPTKAAYKQEKKIGFNDLENGYLILPAIGPIQKYFTNKIEILSDIKLIENALNPHDKKIFNDHNEFSNYQHIMIHTQEGNIYIVYKKMHRKRLPFINLIYISNIILFNNYLDTIRLKLATHLKLAGIIVEKRFIEKNKIKFMIEQKYFVPNIYLSNIVQPKNIDYLYTELILLYNFI